MRVWAAVLAAAAAVPAWAAPEQHQTTETVVVTAMRRAENVDAVAASVGVLTGEDMQRRGVKSFTDLVRYVPGVSLDPASNAISIRGIASTAGAGTTGIYLDDVPIQMRTLDYGSNNTLPAVFDLERVEVLRGPQGTLFGAGSEGGAVRYITSQPSPDGFEARGQAEVSVLRNGALNHEAGASVSGPLDDSLAFRLSAWYRHDGGTVDKIDSDTAELTHPRANGMETVALRAALTWTPTSRLTITPADFHQDRVKHDTDYYWVGASDAGHAVFRSGTPERMSDADHFNLASLKITYAFADADLISNSSYFTRRQTLRSYSNTIYNLSYFQQLIADGSDPLGNPCTAGQCATGLYPLLTSGGFNLPGFGDYLSPATVINRQNNFVQELRLQSNDANARLTWLAGAFFAFDRQHSTDETFDPQLGDITAYLWGETVLDAWGSELPPSGVGYLNSTVAHDRQIAAFANASFAFTPQWKLQGGARFSHTHFDFRNFSEGPENFGSDSGAGEQTEDPVTWMASLSYAPTESDLLYATAGTGYRIGGANQPFPEASCAADLAALGLTSVPESYRSDRVTSYEVGTKNRLLDGRIDLQASAYRADWSRMQQANYLSSCGFQYVANFGAAASTGFDLAVNWIVTEALELHLAAGYMDAHFTADSRSGPASDAPILARRGDGLPGSPWSVSLDASYRMLLGGMPVTARADYSFASHNGRMSPQNDPLTTQFDPGAVNDPATSLLGFRLETSWHDADVTLFVDNALDSRPQLGLTHQDRYTLLYEATTLRPRTIGLSLAYRY